MIYKQTCQIQWVNALGDATPDNNQSIGTVYREEYRTTIMGREHTFPATDKYHICAEHAKCLGERGMEHWKFEASTTTNDNEAQP